MANKIARITEIEYRLPQMGNHHGSFHFSIERASGAERYCEVSFETREAAEEARHAALAMIDKVVNITRGLYPAG
jgi:hypothetical protein